MLAKALQRTHWGLGEPRDLREGAERPTAAEKLGENHKAHQPEGRNARVRHRRPLRHQSLDDRQRRPIETEREAVGIVAGKRGPLLLPHQEPG